MSEVHDQAIHLLAMPQIGTFLTPEGREMVLRALDEVDALRKEIERLQEVAAASQKLFGVKVARVAITFGKVDGHVALVATCPGSDEQAMAEYLGKKLQDVFDRLSTELKDSPAAPKEDVEVPSVTPLPTEPAGDVSFACDACRAGRCHDCVVDGPEFNCRHPGCKRSRFAETNSQQEPEPRDQVAGVEGSNDEGPAHVPEDRGAVVPHAVSAGSADPGEGATASPAAAKWGRADGKGAFHLWREGFSESECAEEVCDGEVLHSDPIPDNTCLSCAAIAGWDVPEKLSKPDDQPELPTIKRTCAGFNKSADVPCGSPSVSVERGGKWFCKRHDPEKAKTCLVPGCGGAGRTAKGSPGIWCKEHAKKLSAEERTDIAERGKRLEAANG